MSDRGLYRYQCIDHSLLDPYLRKYYAEPLHKWIPRWIPANGISLLGHLCVWIVFFLTTDRPTVTVLWVALLLLQFYMVLDVLDGMQARHTQTSSPLGEYIDHGGDAFNCGLIIYSSLRLLDVSSPWFYDVLIALGLVIFSLVSMEKKTTGFCVFPKIGNVELQTFLIVFFASLQIPWVGHKLGVIWFGFSLATWVLLSMAFVGGVLSIVNSLRRIPKLPRAYYGFLILSSLLILGLTLQEAPCTLSVLMLIFFMATYNSEILFSHLTQQKLPWPDGLSSFIIVLLMMISLLQGHVHHEFFMVFLTYLIVRALWSIYHVVRYARQVWGINT